MYDFESLLIAFDSAASPPVSFEPLAIVLAACLSASIFFFLGLNFRRRRKVLLQQLQSSEERYRTLVSNIPGAVYRCACDEAWTMEFISDSIQEINGYPASDFIANKVRCFASTIHADDRQMVQDTVHEAVSRKEPYIIEYRVLHCDGCVRWVYEKGQGVFDESGAVKWLDGVLFDATQRKESEHALLQNHEMLEARVRLRTEELVRANENLRSEILEREKMESAHRDSEEKYKGLFNSSRDGIAVTDMEGRFLDANSAYLDMLGYSVDELRRLTYQGITPHKWHEKEARLIEEQVLQRGYSEEYAKEYIRKDGTIIAITIRAWLMRDALGNPAGFWGLVRDVTEKRKSEESLLKSQERLRRQDRALVELATSKIVGQGDLKKALSKITEAASRTLEVERSGVWLYNEDRTKIHCFDLYERSLERHSDGLELASVNFPSYFKALEKDRVISASNAQSDPRTTEFSDSYLAPLGITSLLDAPIRVEGRMVGVICHEHVGHPRSWNMEDRHFAASIADFVSLALETSQRRQAEESLRAQQNLLHDIIEGTDDRIFAKDGQGRYLLLNSAYASDFRIPAHEAIGLTDRDLCSPTEAEQIMNIDRQIIATGESKSYEQKIETVTDGEVRTYWVGKYPQFDQNNNVTGVLGIARDITERKRAEEALRQAHDELERRVQERTADLKETNRCLEKEIAERKIAEERLQSILDNTTAVIYLKNTLGQYLLINRRFEQLFHTTREHLVGKTDYDLFPKESADVFRANDRKVIETEQALELEEIAPQDDGLHTYISIKFPLRDPSGKVYALCGISTDITERKRAEETVRNLAKFPDEDPSPVLRIKNDGTILYANAASSHLLSSWNCQVGHMLPAPWYRKVTLAVDACSNQELEMTCGNRIYSMIITPITDAGYVNLYASDITRRKRAEEQLSQAQKLKAVGTLASGVAHEFGNLLTAISVHTASAKESLLEGHPAIRTLEKLEETARQARGVTSALLTFSHRDVIRKSAVNVSRNLQETIRLLRRVLPSSINIVEKISSENDLWVRADAGQLQQILMNLALNSRDAMPNGGRLIISLEVCLSSSNATEPGSDPGSGKVAVITVEDTGCGMSEKVRSRVFEPFYTTKPRGQGTGLGLSMILNIIQDLSGKIDIQSKLHQGTRVNIVLPCCLPPRQTSARQFPARQQGQGERILVIERNQHIQSIMTSTLRSHGYEVIPASGVEEAISKIRGQEQFVRLLILDLDLMDKTGLKSFDKLQGRLNEWPVILLAGTISIDLKIYGMENGYLLRKPFEMAELASTVVQCLGESKNEGDDVQ
ncbi:MAG: PAS domain S-box protein [Phycisphaerales bacterium]|nr:PAS domain S-box protein [Phycisphaerales bacterium]